MQKNATTFNQLLTRNSTHKRPHILLMLFINIGMIYREYKNSD